MVCTEPLPKVCEPSTSARLWSCSAPETISEAEALPPFTSTIIGYSPSVPSFFACHSMRLPPLRPSEKTIRPSSIQTSPTFTA